MNLLTALIIAGGVALILFGVRYLRKGLDRLFGQTLGRWIQRLASRRIKAFMTGLGVSLLAPSSTTISVLAVQHVQDGYLTARQALSMMLGANIGMTVMVLLISFRLEACAPLLLLVGVALFQFTKNARARGVGQVILGFGFIFMGVGTITGSPFDPSGDIIQLIQIAQRHPFGMAVLAAILAITIQSSTATIALVIALSAAGTVELPLALAVVVGANLGVGVTTLVFGWRQIESRRLAAANLLPKLAIALLVLLALRISAEALQATINEVDKQIALAHWIFNFLTAVIFLPLVGPLSHLVERLIPLPPPTEAVKFGPRYINAGPIEGFALSSGQSMREIMRVAEIVRSMLHDLWHALESSNEQRAIAVSERDDEVDLLDSEIKRFLTRLSTLEGSQDEVGEQMRQLRYLNELETIGDIIDKNLSELVLKKIRNNVEFSKEGWEELDDFYKKVTENMLIAETAFQTRDRILAQQLLRHKETLGRLERELRDRHFARLKVGLPESHETSAIHLDILTSLKHINSCVTQVVYAIVEARVSSE